MYNGRKKRLVQNKIYRLGAVLELKHMLIFQKNLNKQNISKVENFSFSHKTNLSNKFLKYFVFNSLIGIIISFFLLLIARMASIF